MVRPPVSSGRSSPTVRVHPTFRETPTKVSLEPQNRNQLLANATETPLLNFDDMKLPKQKERSLPNISNPMSTKQTVNRGPILRS